MSKEYEKLKNLKHQIASACCGPKTKKLLEEIEKVLEETREEDEEKLKLLIKRYEKVFKELIELECW